jgi:hypothetical protein
VHPPWQKLLRTPQAEAVYAPRLAAAAPLYRKLLAQRQQEDGMAWLDAFASYQAVCAGRVPLEQLQQLVGMSLESLALGTPQARPPSEHCVPRSRRPYVKMCTTRVMACIAQPA